MMKIIGHVAFAGTVLSPYWQDSDMSETDTKLKDVTTEPTWESLAKQGFYN